MRIEHWCAGKLAIVVAGPHAAGHECSRSLHGGGEGKAPWDFQPLRRGKPTPGARTLKRRSRSFDCSSAQEVSVVANGGGGLG